MSAGVLILGAGQAAAQLAVSLRQAGYGGAIRMVGDEPYAPYQRPPLSKAYLKEKASIDTLLLRGESYWRDHKVELELGTPAAAVDLARKQVGLRDGRSFGYDTLVFATGTRARELPLPGIGLPGVYSLRKIDDVRRLRPALDEARRIAIVGGGYIGLEVAAVMRQEGRDATVVEAEDRVMKRVAGEVVSGFFDTLHRSRGVDIRLNARLAAIEGGDRAAGVALTTGERIAADLVLVATGARANDDLASAMGLSCEDGIVVDDFARAAPDIYAIGDCARFFSHRYGRKIRLECVQNAIDQAKAAAAAIMGQPKSYDPVPWFWSDQYEIKLQIAGSLDGYDACACLKKYLSPVAFPHLSCPQPCSLRASSIAAFEDGAGCGRRQRVPRWSAGRRRALRKGPRASGPPPPSSTWVPEARRVKPADRKAGQGSLASSLAPPGAPSPRLRAEGKRDTGHPGAPEIKAAGQRSVG